MVIDYLKQKGLQYKVRAGQLILNCPFCGETTGHFYMEQQDGAYFCHKCNEKGNLITLKHHFGDAVEPKKFNRAKAEIVGFGQKKEYKPIPDKRVHETHNALLADKEALAYVLEDRKIDRSTVIDYKLGLSTDSDGVRWLTIPHYENGKLVNVKSRTLPPSEKTFRRVKDCKSILFNSDILKTCKDRIFITEGEIDTLTLIANGIKNVVAVTNGAGSFDPEWIDQLKEVASIYLVYDPDDVGQKGAKEAARRLGYDRCYNIVLPDKKDINEYFQKGHEIYSEFQQLVANAKKFDVTGVMSFTDCISKFETDSFNEIQTNGLLSGIVSMDKLNPRGMKQGELWVIASPPGTGKSSLTMQIISNQALQGIPSLFFSLEMNVSAVTEKIIQSYSCKEIITTSDIKKARVAFGDVPLYLGRAVIKPSIESIIEILREAVKRYGLKIIAFDHLHFLCRSVTNQVQEIGLAVQAFKLLAEEMEIPIILIAQPRKLDLTKPMTAEDLKDSSSIHSDADGIIIMHRNRMGGCSDMIVTESLSPETHIRYEKARYGRGGECFLYFHGEYSKFIELES